MTAGAVLGWAEHPGLEVMTLAGKAKYVCHKNGIVFVEYEPGDILLPHSSSQVWICEIRG